MKTAQLIIDYLSNRSNYVQINTQNSTLKTSLNYGVNQGSVMSGFLFLCYTADLPYVNHENTHTSHYEDSKCNYPQVSVYVDDVYSIITSSKNSMIGHII